MSSLCLAKNEKAPEMYKLIQMKSKGYLIEPSAELFCLISVLERATLQVINNKQICSETLFDITAAVDELSPLPLIGCEEHKVMFTHRIIAFYLTTRMFFITKQCNKNDDLESKTTREKRKLSKLSSAPDVETTNKSANIILHENSTENKTKKRKNIKSANEKGVIKKRRIAKVEKTK